MPAGFPLPLLRTQRFLQRFPALLHCLTQENLGVMSIGFMLPNPDDAVIWRGPRKNGLIKQ